jgi:hypothetical protein
MCEKTVVIKKPGRFALAPGRRPLQPATQPAQVKAITSYATASP